MQSGTHQQRSKALQILSSIVSALGRINDDRPVRHDTLIQEPMTFLPDQVGATASHTIPKQPRSRERSIELMALCLWTMAMYSVEERQSERGRMRALRLLHTAAEALRSVGATDGVDSTIRGLPKNTETIPSKNARINTLLRRIEQEAEKMLQPIAPAVEEAAPQAVSNKLNGTDYNPGVLV